MALRCGADINRPNMPRDIDPVDLARVIEAELRSTRNSRSERPDRAQSVHGASSDGQFVLPVDYVERLGDADLESGDGLLQSAISVIRVAAFRRGYLDRSSDSTAWPMNGETALDRHAGQSAGGGEFGSLVGGSGGVGRGTGLAPSASRGGAGSCNVSTGTS
jgi:hypothetical protein